MFLRVLVSGSGEAEGEGKEAWEEAGEVIVILERSSGMAIAWSERSSSAERVL